MNNNIKNTFLSGLIAVAGIAGLYSCSDTWDDHYQGSTGLKYDGTTMQAIQDKASDFADVLKAAGYDRELNSENIYTVWAPANGSFDKAYYLSQIASGDKESVVKRFINSHVARYNISLGNEPQAILLMNSKGVSIGTIAEPTFGKANITAANLSCKNGIINIIDDSNPFVANIYEQIEDLQKGIEGNTLLNFLNAFNTDSLDESRSVYRDVNENGQRVYVDSVMIRNNTVLKSVDALIYEEDSSYTAIIPSAEAFKKRYDIASSLLKFNPKEDVAKEGTCDSLQNYYANMFAMADLYFNDNRNRHQNDSLVSTVYDQDGDWERHVFYKPFSSILAEGKYVNKYECSNGTAYEVDEYPMDITDQFFYRMKMRPTDNIIDRTSNSAGTGFEPFATSASKDFFSSTPVTFYPYPIKVSYQDILDEDGESTGEQEMVLDTLGSASPQSLSFIHCEPSSSSAAPKYSFRIPNTLSGTYEISIVTVPFWAYKGFSNATPDMTGYRFYAYIWQRQNGEEGASAKVGEYPSSGERLVAADKHADKNYVFTQNVDEDGMLVYTDTISLGEVEFKNAYYGRNDEGVILQLVPQVTSAQAKNGTYTKDLLISSIILKPKYKENAEATEIKSR